MNKQNIFDYLYILDMANNHQGSLEHGKKVIEEMAPIANDLGIRLGIKFQYRQLDTFIHPDYRDSDTPKHIKRFLGTQLSMDNFKILVDETKRKGMATICTPFDEESVDVIEQHDIEFIKIASCSAKDWPLLERIALARKPVICSTAGTTFSDIDKIVSFFKHRDINLALMHCVALYPTQAQDLQLNQISQLQDRYPFLPIGFSTHEDPDNTTAVMMAVAKGASLLERHVGIETDTVSLNGYSSTPLQVRNWVTAALEAKKICGAESRLLPQKTETDSLISLQRGTFARKDITEGEDIPADKVFFAMPLLDGQMESGVFDKVNKALKSYKEGDLISADETSKTNIKGIIYSVIHEARAMLYMARIAIGKEFKVELSHHYGVESIREVGAILIDCVNREYCKKLIIQIANQNHPSHTHKKKEETFQVLWGELLLTVDGEERVMKPGDSIIVMPNAPHSFRTKTGVIFEEISSTHFKDDSFYIDKKIYTDTSLRKTKLEHAQHTFEQYNFI